MRARGRGRGRGAAEGSTRSGETSGESSLAHRFGDFGLGTGTSDNPDPGAQTHLSAVEEEVTSPVRRRPKRRSKVSMLLTKS